ncbi:DUF6268 family outer membrane beta-barrel protein [Flagellimonas sp. DF-77]|uniref:DUF6268 family outer membrane beta-barrel protein n=1 Tax=Flagellimonas algarum TaxID=3230298 RepID=UPI003394B184
MNGLETVDREKPDFRIGILAFRRILLNRLDGKASFVAMIKRLLSFLAIAQATAVFAQDLAPMGAEELNPIKLDYGIMPDIGDTEITTYGLQLNFGKPLKKGALAFSLGYRHYDFDFNRSTNTIDLEPFEAMEVVRANVSWIGELGTSTRFVLSAGTALMSNLEDGLSSDDFVFNALAGIIKQWPNSRLLVGVAYGTQFGEPTLLPAISFSQTLGPKWQYSIGLPQTGISFRPNDRSWLALLASPQGIYGNNSGTIRAEGNQVLTNSKIQFNGLNTRLFYQYRFTEQLAFFIEGGMLPISVLRISDSEGNELLDLEPNNGAYANIGLKLVLSKPKKKKENEE